MIYKFKSKAAGDVIMLGPNGDQMLRLLGREPAPTGIFEVADMAAVRHTLQAAVAQQEAEQATAAAADEAEGDDAKGRGVGLRARLWPMVVMLERAEAEREPIVWGV